MNTQDSINKLKELMPSTIMSEVFFLGESTLEVHKDHLKQVLSFLKQPSCGFDVLMDLTGVDYIQPEKKTKVLYWLHNSANF